MKKLYLNLILLLALSHETIHAQSFLVTDFNPQVNFTAAKYPLGIKLADMDGDGHPDMVVANEGAGTVSVFLNEGISGTITTSSFAAKADFSAGTSIGPESLTIADIDQDGKLDIIVSNYTDSTISILRNTSTPGHISFAAVVSLKIGFYAHAISVGSLDGDNYPEIAVVNFDAGVVTIFKNTSSPGTIQFAAGFDIVTGGNPTSVTLGDIDGDGKKDIAVVVHDRGIVSVYRNIYTDSLSAASFAARQDFTAGSAPYTVGLADIDGDGHTDMVVTNIDNQNTVSVFRNTGSSGTISFAAGIDFATGSHPYSLNLTDIDGDGKPDIIAGDWFNVGSASVLRNTSVSDTISFADQTYLITGTNPQAVDAADLNGDGLPDIAVTNSYDGTVSVFQYNPATAAQQVFPESTATRSLGSFVSSDIMDEEWKRQAPGGYNIASDDGTTINAAHNAVGNTGRFVYFWATGSVTPYVPVQGNLTFTAKGSGTIEVQIIADYDTTIQARQTFTLDTNYQNFSWSLTNIYPQNEYFIGVIFNGGDASSQASAQFKKNISLNLRQEGLTGLYTRFRADSTTLIGNTETEWYGWSDREDTSKKKYLQHSAYARMRFQTSATHMVIEYVRDFYDKPLLNLFPLTQSLEASDWDAFGNVISGINVLDIATQVIGGNTYTISGLLTTTPTYVWYNNGTPLGGPVALTNIGTVPGVPIYQVTAPANATNLGLLVQRITDSTDLLSPYNDSYLVYANCMVQEGANGTYTPTGLPIPSAFTAFSGYRPSYISGPAVFINGQLYKYYQVEGLDQAKLVQYVDDDLPAGSKTVEVMMTGQGTYLPADPHIRRAGTYLRAVYLSDTVSTVYPDTTKAAGSICYIHDSILSGYNISGDAQNNVWMMKTKRDTTYGFTGDIFSEGYAGRILYTDIQTDSLLQAFAHKLSNFGVNTYWFQIGVNDYGFVTPLPAFYTDYGKLLDSLHALRPAATFYLQCIGPEYYEGGNAETYADNGLSSTGPTADDFRDVQRALATSRSYCQYVDFEDLFNIHKDNLVWGIDTLADGIHPTDIGNILYANGIKNNSTLLGATLPDSSLGFHRLILRQFIQSVSGIAIVTGRGGKTPYSFTRISGSLPSGLTLNGDGAITGAPDTSGYFTFTVKVTDANGTTASQSFTLTVNPIPTVVVAPIHLRNAKVDSAYSVTFRGYLGYGKYALVQTGTLPPGMTLDTATGIFSGTPTATGTYNFTLTATDHWGFTGHNNYAFVVGSGSPPFLTDSVYVTIAIRSDSLFLQAHLHDIYNTYLFTYMGAYEYVGGSPSEIGSGALVNVEDGLMDGQPVYIGNVTGAWTVIQVIIGVVNPTQLDNTTNILYAPNTYFYP